MGLMEGAVYWEFTCTSQRENFKLVYLPSQVLMKKLHSSFPYGWRTELQVSSIQLGHRDVLNLRAVTRASPVATQA